MFSPSRVFLGVHNVVVVVDVVVVDIVDTVVIVVVIADVLVSAVEARRRPSLASSHLGLEPGQVTCLKRGSSLVWMRPPGAGGSQSASSEPSYCRAYENF